jgi:cell division transport system permease protein
LAHDPIEHDAGEASAGPILPRDTVAGSALVAVIAIMSFLAALTVGSVRIVHGTTAEWRGDIAREATIEVKPVEGRNLEADVKKAVALARQNPAVIEARAYSREESEQLLEPWLGSGIDLKLLPVPRLIRLKIRNGSETDLAALRTALSASGTGGILDDHRAWSSRLSSISNAVTFTGIAVLVLVLAATVLSVSFATRGAVATNRTIVEVLHFVGAHDSYIANAFQHHFLIVGLKGGLIGGVLAAILFALSRFAENLLGVLPNGADAALFLGHFELDVVGYIEIVATVAFITLITALSSRFTVHRTLRTID